MDYTKVDKELGEKDGITLTGGITDAFFQRGVNYIIIYK